MHTFSEFVQQKAIEPQFAQAVELLASMDIDPFEWVLDYSSCIPALEATMMEEWNTFEQTAPAMSTTGQQGAGVQQPTLGGMFRQMGGAIKDYFTGPARRYQAAAAALSWLSQSFKKIDPQGQWLKTGDNKPLQGWMDGVVKELQGQVQRIPALVQQYQQQATAGQTAQPGT